MSILIKGMEMPASCYVCPFCDYVSARCDAVKGTPYTPEDRYEKRAGFCPLVPVPPHGRLGDLDAIAKMVLESVNQEDAQGFMFTKIICQILKDAPTIIPAEEGKKK